MDGSGLKEDCAIIINAKLTERHDSSGSATPTKSSIGHEHEETDKDQAASKTEATKDQKHVDDVDLHSSIFSESETQNVEKLEKQNNGLGVVLLRVFDTMNDFNEVLKLRLVCKTWKKWVDYYHHLLKKEPIIITKSSDIKIYLEARREYMKTKSNELWGVRIYSVSLAYFVLEEKHESDLIELMKLVRGTVKNLLLHCQMHPYVFYKIMSIVGYNLRQLCMRGDPTEQQLQDARQDSQIGFFPIFYKSEALVFPNVQFFRTESIRTDVKLSHFLYTFPNIRHLIVTNIMQENRNIFKKFRPPFLTDLLIGFRSPAILEQYHIDSIINMDLKLKMFYLSFNGLNPKAKYKSYQQLFKMQQGTLEILDLLDNSANNPADVVSNLDLYHVPALFPLEFPKVKYLRICQRFIKNWNNFIRSFPALLEVQLLFNFAYANDLSLIFPKSDSELREAKSVRLLRLHWIDNISFKKLPLVFVNLKTLCLNFCNDEMLRIIFSAYANKLNEFCVYSSEMHYSGGGITEEGIVGLEKARIEKLDIAKPGIKIKKRNWPYFGNMRALEIVELPYNNDESTHEITDKALLFGVFKAPKLIEVTLVGRPKISVAVRNYVEQVGFTCVENAAYAPTDDAGKTGSCASGAHEGVSIRKIGCKLPNEFHINTKFSELFLM